MIKNKTQLEVKIGDRVYALECLPDSPLGELHDALCQMKAFVIGRIVEMQKADLAEIKKDEPVEAEAQIIK